MPGWLTRWSLRRVRVRGVRAAEAPADVLLQSVAVLRHFRARILRCDVETGTLEARLPAGARLRLSAVEETPGSRVTVETEGADWQGVARTLAAELARGGPA
jgi:hypothetical protein